MEKGISTQQTVGRLEIHLDGNANRADSEADLEARKVARFLSDETLKAAVLILLSDPESSVSRDMFHSLKSCFSDATIPLAAVYRNDAADTVRSLAEACLFQYPASNDSTQSTVSEATTRLRAITDKRPTHVIRAVMTSLRNAETMAEAEALLEETKLFCALSRKNRDENKDVSR